MDEQHSVLVVLFELGGWWVQKADFDYYLLFLK